MKRCISLLLVLVLALSVLLPVIDAAAANGVSDFGKITGPTLVKRNNLWYYVKGGKVCYDTALIKYNGGWYYVKNGTTQPSLTTLVKWNGEWWYVVKGKVASNVTNLVKYNGEWFYVVKGKVAGQTTSLIKYNGEWFYVVKGKVAGNTTTLIKYNGGWYYIHKGKQAAKTTTLFKYNGSWYYVENGKVNFSKTGLFQYNGQKYYIKNGVAQTGYTGYITYQGQRIYLRNGAVSTPSKAKPVVDAVSYERRVNPPSELAGYIASDLKQIIHIPKLNYNKPGALALNRKIYAYYKATYEYVKNASVDDWAFRVTYEYREHNGIIGIIVEREDAPLGTGYLEDYVAYYYDANNDRELTQSEYYKALGINAATLTVTLKNTPTFKSNYNEDYIYDVYLCIFGKDSSCALFESDEYNYYAMIETDSIL